MKIPILFAKSLAAKNVWNLLHGTGLWVQIAFQKYIYPLSLMDWIRVIVKKKLCMSICWKSVLWSFDLIGNYLIWKVGNGANVRIGLVIQEDIGGHPPIPLGPPPLFLSVFQFP